MNRSFRGALLFVVVLLLISVGAVLGFFMFQNAQWVVIHIPTVTLDWDSPFSVVEYETPLAMALAVAVALGCVVTTLVFLPARLGRALERRRERRFITNLEGELTDLRNLPLTGPAPLEDMDDSPVERDRDHRKSSAEEDEALLIAALQSRAGRKP